MSGLEIIALVPAIISAYSAAATEYKAWRKRKKKRAKEAQNTALQTSLDSSGTIIEAQYKLDIQHLGRVFEKGDEIGCGALKDQLIILQNSVIMLLVNARKSDTFTNIIHPSHDTLWSESNAVRGNIMTALAEQYQRIQGSKPIQAALPAPTPASEPVVTIIPDPPKPEESSNCQGIIKYEAVNNYKGTYSCELCKWSATNWEGNNHELGFLQSKLTKDGRALKWFDFAQKFHYMRDGYDQIWRCHICAHHPVFRIHSEMANHCKYFHTQAEILDKSVSGFRALVLTVRGRMFI